MKKIFYTILCLLLMNSCNNENEEQYNLDVGFELSIINSNGEDILNPNHTNAIKHSDIKLFYLINGEKEEVYNGNYTYPRNFKIYEHQNEFRIGISQNYSDMEEKPLTYIQWNDIDTDTIESIYERNSNSVLQRKIWINGDLLWESNSGIEPFFVITK